MWMSRSDGTQARVLCAVHCEVEFRRQRLFSRNTINDSPIGSNRDRVSSRVIPEDNVDSRRKVEIDRRWYSSHCWGHIHPRCDIDWNIFLEVVSHTRELDLQPQIMLDHKELNKVTRTLRMKDLTV